MSHSVRSPDGRQKIVPHLWFDKEATPAAQFYVSAFSVLGDSKVTSTSVLDNTPSGSVDVVSFQLAGHTFAAISAGPLFTFNPSTSFIVGCETADEVNTLWEKLSQNGKPLMPLDKYPFSERFGWIQDKYGLSWQLILTKPEGEERPKIVPSLLFVQNNCGKAEAAIKFYVSVFTDAKTGTMMRYPAGMAPEKEGTIQFADFMLEGVWFAAMDSAREHKFAFNEAVSFMVYCETQAEIDYYWEKLSAVPESEQCGWLKDKFGLSWQIVPRGMDEMMKSKDKAKVARVTAAFLKMKKFNLAELERAAAGK